MNNLKFRIGNEIRKISMEAGDMLQKLGFDDKEASAYLALLELGAASVDAIAKKAGLKRPTTYLVLDDLQARGVVSIVPRAKKMLYTAESPETIVGNLARKQDLFKRFLPQLLAMYNARKDKPQVQLFEGQEGVRLVYQKIFEAGSVWFFGTTKEIAKLDPSLLTSFLKRIIEHNLSVRDLLTRSQEDLAYAKRMERGPSYEIRFLPHGMEFPSDSALFGNNVVFFSFRPQIFSVMITSADIAQSLKTLYSLAWDKAEAYIPHIAS